MTATRPEPRAGVLTIDAYVPGKSTAPGVAKVFKLSSKETPLGPSPKAIAADPEALHAATHRPPARPHPEADRALSGARQASRGFPRRIGFGAARGDRPR